MRILLADRLSTKDLDAGHTLFDLLDDGADARLVLMFCQLLPAGKRREFEGMASREESFGLGLASLACLVLSGPIDPHALDETSRDERLG